MKPPVVSIVMPAFNAEKFICESIGSVLAQTMTDWELLVVDDGSADNTSKIVEGFLSDSRIRLIRQKNAGVSAARNAALKQATGEWIAFLDADDVWFPEKLAEQLAAVSRRPDINLVFTNYFIWDGQHDLELRFKTPDKFPSRNFHDKLIFHNLFGMSSVLMRRTTLLAVGDFDPEVAPAEDWDLWLRIADAGLVAHGINKPLLRYRVWGGNASRNGVRMMQGNVRVLEKAVTRSKDAHTQSLRESALRAARGHLELAYARVSLESAPANVAPSILRAWRHSGKVKWLGWYLAMIWPKFLGGNALSGGVIRKLEAKY